MQVRTVIENVKGERVYLACPDYVSDAAINLSENSVKVLEKRYLRRDYDGSFLETPAGMFYRVAYHIAQVESEHGGDAAARRTHVLRSPGPAALLPQQPHLYRAPARRWGNWPPVLCCRSKTTWARRATASLAPCAWRP